MKIESKLLTINHGKGRGGRQIDAVVIHVVAGRTGSMTAMREWFKNPASNVSAHYGISRSGGIEQYVREEDTAWANGRVLRPRAALVLERPGVNPNLYTVSVEHEGLGDADLTDLQREASAWLVADVARRNDFPISRRHVLRHDEIYAAKSCPGKIDVDAIVRLALQETGRPAPPRLVWSDYFKDWLIVTRVISDAEWYFVPAKSLSGEQRAQTPLSRMPTA